MPLSEVYNEDCMVGMTRFPDNFFDLAVVDPPYGIGIHKAAYIEANKKTALQKNGNRLYVRKKNYKRGEWDNRRPKPEYFTELRRISKQQVIWGWNYYGLNWGEGLIKWNKLRSEGVSFSQFEYAYCSLLDREIEFQLLWSGFLQAISLTSPSTPQGNKRLNEKRIHPTQKPVLLYKWLLNNYAQPGNKIIDTHMGSQSSRIAAYQMGFDYWGWEIDEEYFDAGNKRFKEQTAQILLL